MTYERGLLPLSALGAANGAIAARASQLRRRLRGAGFQLHDNLLEVSPAATIAALCGSRTARGYKRDADPWRTRALILEQLDDLSFAPQSRMAREDVLRQRPLLRCRDQRVHRVSVGARWLDRRPTAVRRRRLDLRPALTEAGL